MLKVTDVIVCGHYSCGGVRAALGPAPTSMPHVARHIRPLYKLAQTHGAELNAISELEARVNRLSELSVLQQVRHLRAAPVIRDASPPPRVHGWVFGLHDGHLKVLTAPEEVAALVS